MIVLGSTADDPDPLSYECVTHEMNLGRHDHSVLSIFINGNERQIPEIAETKIRGLKQFYGVNSKKGLEFFEAHKAADVIHREECEKLLDGLTKKEQEKAEQASLYTARYLWNFLSGMVSKHKLQVAA